MGTKNPFNMFAFFLFLTEFKMLLSHSLKKKKKSKRRRLFIIKKILYFIFKTWGVTWRNKIMWLLLLKDFLIFVLRVDIQEPGQKHRDQKKVYFRPPGKRRGCGGGEKWEDLQRVHGRAYEISCLWRRGIIKESGRGCCQSFSLGNWKDLGASQGDSTPDYWVFLSNEEPYIKKPNCPHISINELLKH